MKNLGYHIQEADWKKEKHVPVIERPDSAIPGEFFDIRVSLGKAIVHPNTTGHHIRWIQVFFQPEDGKFNCETGGYEFSAHGESLDGPGQGTRMHEPQRR